MEDKSQPWEASEAEKTAARLRLKGAREAAGKDHQDLGYLVGGDSNYWDLEQCNGELFMAIDLGELVSLCTALGIRPCDLFRDQTSNEPMISPEELISMAEEHLKRTGLTVAEFEEVVGFEIGPALKDPTKVADWNVDFLRWLCRELGLDWGRALL